MEGINPVASIEFEEDYKEINTNSSLMYDIHLSAIVNDDATEKLIWTISDPDGNIEVSEDTKSIDITWWHYNQTEFVVTATNQDGTISASCTIRVRMG